MGTENEGCTTFEFRKNAACAAYALTASYDSMVSTWMEKQVSEPPSTHTVSLAAALFRGELHGRPEGRAFPGAWESEPHDSAGAGGPGAAQTQGRRPPQAPRGPIPARHRRRMGGG